MKVLCKGQALWDLQITWEKARLEEKDPGSPERLEPLLVIEECNIPTHLVFLERFFRITLQICISNDSVNPTQVGIANFWPVVMILMTTFSKRTNITIVFILC